MPGSEKSGTKCNIIEDDRRKLQIPYRYRDGADITKEEAKKACDELWELAKKLSDNDLKEERGFVNSAKEAVFGNCVMIMVSTFICGVFLYFLYQLTRGGGMRPGMNVHNIRTESSFGQYFVSLCDEKPYCKNLSNQTLDGQRAPEMNVGSNYPESLQNNQPFSSCSIDENHSELEMKEGSSICLKKPNPKDHTVSLQREDLCFDNLHNRRPESFQSQDLLRAHDEKLYCKNPLNQTLDGQRAPEMKILGCGMRPRMNVHNIRADSIFGQYFLRACDEKLYCKNPSNQTLDGQRAPEMKALEMKEGSRLILKRPNPKNHTVALKNEPYVGEDLSLVKLHKRQRKSFQIPDFLSATEEELYIRFNNRTEDYPDHHLLYNLLLEDINCTRHNVYQWKVFILFECSVFLTTKQDTNSSSNHFHKTPDHALKELVPANNLTEKCIRLSSLLIVHWNNYGDFLESKHNYTNSSSYHFYKKPGPALKELVQANNLTEKCKCTQREKVKKFYEIEVCSTQKLKFKMFAVDLNFIKIRKNYYFIDP